MLGCNMQKNVEQMSSKVFTVQHSQWLLPGVSQRKALKNTLPILTDAGRIKPQRCDTILSQFDKLVRNES